MLGIKLYKNIRKKNNWEKNQLEVYPGMNKDQLDKGEVQNCILEVPLENGVVVDDEVRNNIRQTLSDLKG